MSRGAFAGADTIALIGDAHAQEAQTFDQLLLELEHVAEAAQAQQPALRQALLGRVQAMPRDGRDNRQSRANKHAVGGGDNGVGPNAAPLDQRSPGD